MLCGLTNSQDVGPYSMTPAACDVGRGRHEV